LGSQPMKALSTEIVLNKRGYKAITYF